MGEETSRNRDRVFFVVNNRSGNANEGLLRELVDQKLVRRGIECHYFVREQKGQSRRKATRKALKEGFRTIVAVGGDGTVTKVADEVQHVDGAILGILPLGSANLLARGIDLPLDLESAVELLAERPRIRRVDGMKVGTKTYFSHISMGIYSDITSQESKEQKQRLGKLAYLWPLFSEVRRQRSWKFTLDAPEIQKQLRASLVMVANVGDTGFRDVTWGAGVRPDDGRLDLCLIKGRSLGAYAGLFWKSLRGKIKDSPHAAFRKLETEITIKADTNLPVRADGSLIGEREVHIRLIKDAVGIIAPAKDEIKQAS